MNTNSYIISSPSDIDSLKSALSRSFSLLKETTGSMNFEIYDTFDWRLHRNGWQLLRNANHYDIIRISTGEVVSGIDMNDEKKRRFSWDFPASDFASHLCPVLEMRAIMPVCGIERKLDRLAVCNADEKTVARIEFESLARAGEGHCVTHCRLLPMKGYGPETRRIRAIIKEVNLSPATICAEDDLLRRSGINPGSYSSKIEVALLPEMPAATAVQLILKNLVTVMHQNLEGVMEDIDTEFLHDLRVAIRRARSLLSQTKGVLGGETTAALQAHLKTMGDVSGQVRDLDVYLLKKEDYIQKVPDTLKPGILQLFRALHRKRRMARDHMLKVMGGTVFIDALAALDGFLESDPVVHEGPAGVTPIGKLANTIILKRFRRIIQRGSRIFAETPDEKLHELRIDCKKLRYLLEFFTSLFPADQMKRLIDQLKGLQDNLGNFNDLSIQQSFLSGYLASIKPQTPTSVMMGAATGGLIARLFMDQERVRSEFFSVFKRFSSEENKARFKALFI